MRYLFLLAFWFLSLACAAKSPTAAVRGVSLGAVDAQGMTVNLAVSVTNPNSFAIPLAGASYSASLAGARTVTGTFVPSASLAANAETPVTVPIGIRWDDLLATKEAVVRSGGDVPFAVSAKIVPSGALAMLGDQAAVRLDYSGKLPLKQALRDPQAALNSPAARELAQALLRGLLP